MKAVLPNFFFTVFSFSPFFPILVMLLSDAKFCRVGKEIPIPQFTVMVDKVLTFPGLSFFICKIEIVIISTSQVCLSCYYNYCIYRIM